MKLKLNKFSHKLFLTYLALCLLPLTTVTVFFYSQAKSDIQETATDFIQLYSSQTANLFQTYLSQIDYVSNAVFTDYELMRYLSKESEYSTYEKIRHNLTIQLMFARFASQLPYVQGTTIVNRDGKIYSYGFSPNPAADGQSWFEEIKRSSGQLIITPSHSQTTAFGKAADIFSVGRVIRNPEGELAGYLVFHLTPVKLVASDPSLDRIGKRLQTRLVVTTADDRPIYDSSHDAGQIFDPIPAVQSPDTYTLQMNIADNQLKIYVSTPVSLLYNRIVRFRDAVLLSSIIVVVLILIFSMLISYQITKPIHRLIKGMRLAEDGNYLPISTKGIGEEFQLLANSYNTMIMKVKHLVEDVFVAKLKEHQAMMFALQNQINPHWLYNTLESIRMKAIVNKDPEVADMVKKLGRLFRLALDQRSEENRIRNEIEYVSLYVDLQNIRYDGRFVFRSKLTEDMLNIPILPLVLQPLIENAIIHGFHGYHRSYTIELEGRRQGSSFILSVLDDGQGMDQEALAVLRNQLVPPAKRSIPDSPDSRESLGLRNIHERLVLRYGEGYGLSIESEKQKGTCVTVHIPYKELNEACIPS